MNASVFASRRQEALELRDQGFGYRRIAKALGCSRTTARRLTKPGYEEHLRQLSLAAKKRRLGKCERCGEPTRYNGHGRSTSRYCTNCGSAVAREMARDRRGQGPTLQAILAFLADGEKRYMEIVEGVGLSRTGGIRYLGRLLDYGLVERPRRGVYRAVKA